MYTKTKEAHIGHFVHSSSLRNTMTSNSLNLFLKEKEERREWSERREEDEWS